MDIKRITTNYFNGFNELYEARKNTALTNLCAVIKVLSYLTLVIPAIVYGIHKASSLFGRVQTSPPNQSQANTINQTAQGTLTSSTATSDSLPSGTGASNAQDPENPPGTSTSPAQPESQASEETSSHDLNEAAENLQPLASDSPGQEEVNSLDLDAASEHVRASSEVRGSQASEEAEILSDTHSVSSSSSGTESPIFEETSDTGSRAAATTVPILGVPNNLGTQKKTSSGQPIMSKLLAAAAKIASQQRVLTIVASQTQSPRRRFAALQQNVNEAMIALLRVIQWLQSGQNTKSPNSGNSSTDPQS